MPQQMHGMVEAAEATGIRDGRFEGRNDHAFVELRVDAGGAGLVSADLYRLGPDDRRDWVASARSAPGRRSCSATSAGSSPRTTSAAPRAAC